MGYAHMGFAVKDLEKSKEFYAKALAPLGLGITSEGENWAAIGKEGRNLLWIGTFGEVPGPIHFAFEAANHEEVDAFHKAGLEAGGKDNGAPGIRENYSPTYYAAFLIDPDGHNVEAVSR
jgi:catechol 2,3-dioxygenase-like lactoylglutathione lyase family enzyme